MTGQGMSEVPTFFEKIRFVVDFSRYSLRSNCMLWALVFSEVLSSTTYITFWFEWQEDGNSVLVYGYKM